MPNRRPDAGESKPSVPPLLLFLTLGFLLVISTAFFSLIAPQFPSRMGRASALLIDDLPLWRAADNLPLPFLNSPQWAGTMILATTGLAFTAYTLAIYWSRRCHAAPALYSISIFIALALFATSLWALPKHPVCSHMMLMFQNNRARYIPRNSPISDRGMPYGRG